jgi:hypothetical protein
MNTRITHNAKLLFISLTLILTCKLSLAQIPVDSLFFHAPFNSHVEDTIGEIEGDNYGGTFVQDRFINDTSAIYFDGVNDYVDFDNDIKFKNMQWFSVSFWVMPEYVDYPKSGRFTIFGDIGYQAGHRFFQSGDEIHFSISAPTDFCFYELQESDKNDWLHVVGVADSGSMSIYVNGKRIKTVTPQNSKPKIGQQNFEFGRGTVNNSGNWAGRLDEVRMYNKPLTATEIKNMYETEIYNVCMYSATDSLIDYDTVNVNVFDTTMVFENVYDTVNVLDTQIVKINDTAISYVYVYDTLLVHDTIWFYDYETVEVIKNEKVTVPIYDTIFEYLYDSQTVYLTKYDTVIIEDTLDIQYNTSIADVKLNQVMLYPIPANDVLIVEFSEYQEHVNITLTNTLGQIVWASENSGRKVQIDVSRFDSPQVYTLSIYNKQGGSVFKRNVLIKN